MGEREQNGEPAEVVYPPGVAQAWGLQPGKKRGPKPALNLNAIVQAAIDLADERGLAAVSMQSVAKRLHFTAMSLYRHVSAKDDLLALMMDAAFGDPPPELREIAHWRDACRAWADAALQQYRRHPWVLDIPIFAMPMLPYQLLWLDTMLGALRDTGLGEAEKLSVALLVSTYVMNVARMERDLTSNVQLSNQQSTQQYEELLSRMLSPEVYPHLQQVVQNWAFSQEEYDQYEYTFGINRILDGVAVLIEQRANAAG